MRHPGISLPKQDYFGQVNDSIAASAQNSFEHEQAEAGGNRPKEGVASTSAGRFANPADAFSLLATKWP